jgi:glycosyltransferase involved in cell wall biosynthesis
MRITFVSNFELEDISGGWNGINANVFNELKKVCDIEYVGGINPPFNYLEKAVSKLRRVLHFKGSYSFFAESRLNEINRQLTEKGIRGDQILYFGATPWVKHRFSQPYSVYMDICFQDYIGLYIGEDQFDRKDISRIVEQEKFFLENARWIFWGSNWAHKQAEKLYHTTFPNSVITSTGGNIPIPDCISSDPERKLLFISLDFEKKGGHIAYEAFLKVKEKFPDTSLSIIGQKPPGYVLETPGVNYVGLLNKKSPRDIAILQYELNSSFFLIHPTKMDTMGAVIAEAGYYGLPSIAPDNFGIPDLIENGSTGFMVPLPLSAEKFSVMILEMMDNMAKYLAMRKNVREFMVKERSWTGIANKLVHTLSA